MCECVCVCDVNVTSMEIPTFPLPSFCYGLLESVIWLLWPDVYLLVLPDTTILSFIFCKVFVVMEFLEFWSYSKFGNCFLFFLQFPNSINRELNVCKICESWIWIKLCENQQSLFCIRGYCDNRTSRDQPASFNPNRVNMIC